MKLVSLLFASAFVLMFGIATLFCGSMALAQTRTQGVTVTHDLGWQPDPSEDADTPSAS